jgi:4-diphosphocytidyl-2-C-methyl-D-erythritol kinase
VSEHRVGQVALRSGFAKVNLALAVGRPEGPKGYHPISSWMACVDLRDDLHLLALEPSRASRYAILWHDDAPKRSDIDWPITKDLAVRAQHALEERIGRRLTIQLKMEKRVPVGAGMGGGSSDAAAMLLALRDLYAIDLDDAALREVGATIGSDIAYFIDSDATPRPAIVEGFGDRIERVEPAGEPRWLTMLFPSFGCETAAVYRAFDDLADDDHELLDDEVRALAMSGDLDGDALFNDLARAACAVRPKLGELRAEAARTAESPVHVTGSGSALFIVSRDPEHAQWLALRLRDDLSVPVRALRVFA